MPFVRWFWLLVALCLLPTPVNCQVLRVVNANCEIYSLTKLPCLPSVEIHRVSPPSFISFADSALEGFSDCDPRAVVATDVEQISTLLADSAYIHAYAYGESRHGPGVPSGQVVMAHSDASIVFRVDAGRKSAYALDVFLGSEIGGGGTAIASFSLTRMGPGGGVIQSARVQSGPGLPLEAHGEIQPTGTLVAGDYAIEAHVSADGHPGPFAKMWMRLKLRDVTAVAPATWGLVKSLYRTSP